MVLFVDGLSSHKADLCQTLNIVLISLYPNTTHITQPADVGIFKPLKEEWRRVMEEWRNMHFGEKFTLLHFGPALTKTVEQGIKPESIINAFRVCGLFPFDPENVDYTKCLARTNQQQVTTESSPPEDIGILSMSMSEQSDGDHFENEGQSTPIHSNTLISSDRPALPLQTLPQYVSIHIDKIVQAVDMIGTQTMLKIQGDVSKLTREERIIRFFYYEFVHPHITIKPPTTMQMLPVKPVVIENFFESFTALNSNAYHRDFVTVETCEAQSDVPVVTDTQGSENEVPLHSTWTPTTSCLEIVDTQSLLHSYN